MSPTMADFTRRFSMVLPVTLAACVSSASLFPYLPPRPSNDRGTSFEPLGAALVDALSRRDLDSLGAESRPDAPPLGLTSSDGAGLAIERLDVATVIEGPLALTEMRLRFKNPEPRVLEGRFAITLPPDAAVSRFAMHNAEWLEAEIVARQRAREVYESYLHVNADPALLEKGEGNSFSARVFPIAASGTKELIITYSQEVSALAPYRVRLAGLPRVGQLTWTYRDLDSPTEQDGKPSVVRNTLPHDLQVPYRGIERATTDGDAFVARLQVPGDRSEQPFGRVVLLVDTSASRGAVRHRQFDVVRTLIHGLEARDPDAVIDVFAFDQGSEKIVAGPAADRAGGIHNALAARGALGASDLGAVFDERHAELAGARVILVSDGVATTGIRDAAGLATRVRAAGVARLDAVTVGGSEDRARLDAMVAAGVQPGVVVDGEASGDLVAGLATPVLGTAGVAVDGAAWVWPATLAGIRAGDEVVVYGRRRPGAKGPLRVRLGAATTTLAEAAGTPALVQRAVAGAEIERLEAGAATSDPAIRRAEVERLGLAHRLITSQTSLLVLESEAEYARFCLGRTGLGDVLTIAKDGIAVIDRHDGKPEPTSGCAAPGGATLPDGVGVSFSGATSLENTYYVDGINTSGMSEVIAISDTAPMIDQTATTMGITIETGRPDMFNLGDSALGITGGHPGSLPWPRTSADYEPDPPPPPAAYSGRLLQVMQELRAGRHDRALAEALRWHLAEPTELAALIGLGEALEASGAPALAARAYGSILDLYPGRVELVRAAAERLDRLGPAGRSLAIDAYQRAVVDRPDHVTGYRLLAWALVRAGRHDDGLRQLERALGRADRDSVRRLLRDEMGLIGAAWAAGAATTAERDAIATRLARRGAAIATAPSLRIVLSWETDANDVDLHVRDAQGGHAYYGDRSLWSGGRLADDLTGGYGPEVFVIDGVAGAAPYKLSAHYYRRGPMGLGLGTAQIIIHDGAGGITIDDRPFVIQNDDAFADLGVIPPTKR